MVARTYYWMIYVGTQPKKVGNHCVRCMQWKKVREEKNIHMDTLIDVNVLGGATGGISEQHSVVAKSEK